MSKKNRERKKRLMPGGVPRWIRCYDNGGKTADRYTVVYTGLYNNLNRPKRGGERYAEPFLYFHTGMSTNPFHPQGFCQHGESTTGPIDWPRYSHLGKPIAFLELPSSCRNVIVTDYMSIWQLELLTDEEYVESKVHCPRCGSITIAWGLVIARDDVGRGASNCHTCGYEWFEEFELIGYTGPE